MTIFLDDLSMPETNKWGDQPTLELVRQLVETQGFCFLDKDKRATSKTSRICNIFVLWVTLGVDARTYLIV